MDLITHPIATGIGSFVLLAFASYCVGEGGEILGQKYDASVIGGLLIAWLNTGTIFASVNILLQGKPSAMEGTLSRPSISMPSPRSDRPRSLTNPHDNTISDQPLKLSSSSPPCAPTILVLRLVPSLAALSVRSVSFPCPSQLTNDLYERFPNSIDPCDPIRHESCDFARLIDPLLLLLCFSRWNCRGGSVSLPWLSST